MHKEIMKNGLWMLGGNGLQQILQFLIFILLARYLDPAVFGYVALATVVLDIASLVGRWGIADVLLQRQRVSPLFLSHSFLFAITMGICLSLAVIGGTFVFIALYGFTVVAKLLLILVPVIMVQAVELIPEALVRRNLDFKRLAFRNNLAALLGGFVAVLLAFLDMGVYALAAQRLVSVSILLAMVWISTGRQIRLFPARMYRFRLFAGIGKAGSHMVSSPLSALLGPRLSDMLVGICLGPVALGQLKIARRIFDFVAQLTITPLSNVAQAAFPRLMNDKSELKKIYARVQGLCALGVFPLFAGLAVTADTWVPLLLGIKWIPAIPAIRWTCAAGIPAVVNYFQLPLLITFHRNRLIFRQNIFRVGLSILLSGIGVLSGLTTVVILFVLMAYGFMIYNWIMIRRIAGWTIRDNLGNLCPAFCATLALVAGVLLVQQFIGFASPWADLAVSSLTGAVAYFTALLIGFRTKTVAALREMLRIVLRREIGQKA